MRLHKLLYLGLLPLTLLAQEATVEQLFSVQSVSVKKSSLSHEKKSYGYVKADEARVVDVTPRFGGYVVKLYANKVYKYVKKGDPLVRVYSPEVYKAKEDYINSYKYTKTRENKGMLRSAKLKLQLLGLSNQEIAATLKKKKMSENTTIYAPISGYIFKKNIKQGAAFNAKTALFEIVSLDEVWVEAKVFEEDIAWLKKADDFEVSFKSNNRTYKATSTLLYPNLDPKEATLTLRLRLKNTKGLLFPGMYANVSAKGQSETYLTLPQHAVLRKDGKYYVFIVGEFEGEYEPLEVHVKVLNSSTYIVTQGVSEGDEVVANALFMMDSDAQINGLY